MSETKTQERQPQAPTGSSNSKNAAFAEKFDDLEHAIERLYIKTNISGRNYFRAAWPDIALYIFGEQLIDYDNNGTSNIDHRSELEEHAMERRFHLLDKIKEIRARSVESGVLDLDYLKSVIDHFGPHLCQHIYKQSIIERLYPNAFSAQAPTAETSAPITPQPAEPQEPALSAEEKQILSNQDASQPHNMAKEELDTVQPIDTPAPLADIPVTAETIVQSITHPLPDVESPEPLTQKVEATEPAPLPVQVVEEERPQSDILPTYDPTQVEPSAGDEDVAVHVPGPAPTKPPKGFLRAQFGLVCK